jgi:hypothetical protein
MYRRARRADKQPVTVFAERWWQVLPLPLTDHDRTAGYWWEISLRQVEVSRTLVFAAPRHARAFFEALVADNLDIGRPEQLEVIVNDLARLRRNIHRLPGRNLYTLTADGLRFAIFYTTIHSRVLRPAPPALRAALRTIDHHIDQRLAHARLPTAA